MVEVVPSEKEELLSHSFGCAPFGGAVPGTAFREPWKDDRRVDADDFLRIPGRTGGSIVAPERVK